MLQNTYERLRTSRNTATQFSRPGPRRSDSFVQGDRNGPWASGGGTRMHKMGSNGFAVIWCDWVRLGRTWRNGPHSKILLMIRDAGASKWLWHRDERSAVRESPAGRFWPIRAWGSPGSLWVRCSFAMAW